jgi:hypothetical protein
MFMASSDIVTLRLHNQHLSNPTFKSPAEVVEYLGAVQAQDYAAAKWSVGLRMKDSTEEIIEQSFNDGLILRTHVMRPTWHFVMPQDIRWMLELTAPQVKRLMVHYDRKLEITSELISKCKNIVEKALAGGKYLTRTEIADLFEKAKIPARGQRLGHIMMAMELDALICSGPRRGKPASPKTTSRGGQFTYALIEERAPKVKKLNREESLANLAIKYFAGHGPAQIKDFSWWSGLSIKDSTIAVELIKSKLTQEILDGKIYFFFPASKVIKQPSPTAHLLSIYDEYVIAYKDRSALGSTRYVEKFISMGNALTAVIILNGFLVGTWKRIIKKENLEVLLSPLRDLTKSEVEAMDKAAKQYSEFLGLNATISFK